jgi:large subunit ribosomal protein L25
MPKLKATERDLKTKLEGIRKEGLIPAVYYGKKEKSTPITMSAKEFKKVWDEVGETGVVELETPKGKLNVMVYDVQANPVKNEVLHVDFYVVEKGQKVEVEVPIVFVGVSPAVKDLGGILVKVLHEITVEGEPGTLPDEIVVDISVLVDLESQILVKDLKIPKGVEILLEDDEVVAAISEAEEEVEVSTTEVDMSAIEVEKKGKKEVPAEE